VAHTSSAVSANSKRVQSQAVIMPFSTSASKLTTDRQYASSNRIVAIGGILPVSLRLRIKQHIQRAEATREGHEGVRAHGQVHLAHGEVTKAEGQLGCGIRVRLLLVRERDIEADRGGSSVEGTPIGRLHQAWTASSRNDIVPKPAVRVQSTTAFGCEAPEGARLLIPERMPPRPVFRNPGGAEHDDG
jgi:hypothetical protein